MLLEHEGALRLGVFLGLLVVMAAWEMAAPQRRATLPRLLRWSNNLALVALDTVVLRLALPVLAVGLAAWAQVQGWGLFNLLAVPGWLAILASLVLLDLAIWAQHLVFHKVPVLWRLHRMHHADPDFDVTTALRFHPIEILLSMLVKMAVVLALGVPPEAVLLFEVILNGMAIFNHANVRLPRGLDAGLRLAVVTPDMHRVHHSDIRAETDSNYGFNLSLWDRLFGTYVAAPAKGQVGMTIGLDRFRTARDQWLDRLLLQPFSAGAPGYDAGQDAGFVISARRKPAGAFNVRSQPDCPASQRKT